MTLVHIGYVSADANMKKKTAAPQKLRKRFTMTYDPEKMQLKCTAKITIGDSVYLTENAIWDTGASITVINQSAADSLYQPPVDGGDAVSASGKEMSDIYLATLELPGGIIFQDVKVWTMDISMAKVDVIIGMDIISQGKLTVGSIDGSPSFSFEIYQ